MFVAGATLRSPSVCFIISKFQCSKVKKPKNQKNQKAKKQNQMAAVSRPVFSGRENVQEWLSDFHWHTLSMHIVNDEARLHVFPITLQGEALDWFEDLPPERKQTWD